MAKKRTKKEAQTPERKGSPLVYAIVFLLAGALVGGVLSTAIHTSQQKPVGQQESALAAQIKTFSDRVALNPRDEAAWVSLGNLYFDSHQHEQSIEAYARALEINPANPNVLTDKGVMHRALGEYQKALECFAKAIDVDPMHETARLNTGVVLFHDVGDKAGAIKAWQDLVEVNPKAKNADGSLVADMLRQMGAAPAGKESGRRLLSPGTGS